MVAQLAEIFFNVITPVFALVLIGYLASPRLQLEARTLSRTAYFVFIPAFVFDVISDAEVEAELAARMILFILAVQAGSVALGFLMARLLRVGRKKTGAYILIAVFGNVGNFGLPLIAFRLGDEALVAATVYFLAIVVSGFVIGVSVASFSTGSGPGAVADVLKTPALLALTPALVVNGADLAVPLFLERIVGLLAAAMVPTMLVTLGAQLAEARQIRFNRDVIAASAVRLLGAPALAIALAALFDLTGIERGAGIFQAAMPAAVLTSIIALEYDMEADFVTTTVLFSTLASVVTLTLLLALV